MIKPMKAVRRDILKLIQIYIEKETHFDFFNQNFLPALQAMVQDYQQSDANARDPETMMLFATIFNQEGEHLAGFLVDILCGLCQPTLEMISSDFISYPEFREPFFKLVHNIILHCTQGMFELQGQMF